MNIQRPLTNDLVRRPDLWQLLLRVSSDTLDVLLYSPVENNTLIYRPIEFGHDERGAMAAMQEAVYDNPVLLNDFGKTTVIVETRAALPIPAGIESVDSRELLFETAFPGFDGELIDNELGAVNASVIFGVDRDLAAFVERTFFGARVMHHLVPLCRYFIASARRANGPRVYANLRQGSVDIIAVDHGRLLIVNTFDFKTPLDAVYYILACYHVAGLDMVETELHISGNQTVRDEIVPTLRDYIGSVMPVIFPSTMFKAGKDAMKAPFDLIVLPLCE